MKAQARSDGIPLLQRDQSALRMCLPENASGAVWTCGRARQSLAAAMHADIERHTYRPGGIMSGLRAPMSKMDILSRAWLTNDLCRAHGWNELPRDRPLWRLRCTAAEVARMRELLMAYLRANVSPTPYVSALFCLYAAEALRRGYQGGARSWDLVASGLGGHLTQSHLRELTEEGLKFWKRPLRVGGDARQFLHSLALEGGIPDSLISGDAKTITVFLRNLLADVEAFGAHDFADACRLAAQSAAMLPSTWQEGDVLEMAATLALEIARIRLNLRGLSFHQIANWFAAHACGCQLCAGVSVDPGARQPAKIACAVATHGTTVSQGFGKAWGGLALGLHFGKHWCGATRVTAERPVRR